MTGPLAPPERTMTTEENASETNGADGAKPYFGATGFKTPEQVRAVADLGIPRELARRWGRRFMVGALVNGKTLAGMPTSNPRYPTIEAVREVMAAAEFGVVHFNTSLPVGLTGEVRDAATFAELELLVARCPSLRGIQLNAMRPDPVRLADFAAKHPQVELILQVSRDAVDYTAPATHSMAPRGFVGASLYEQVRDFIDAYGSAPAHALLDPSMGEGQQLKPETVGSLLRNFGRRTAIFGKDHVRFGVAGGFGADEGTAERVARLGQLAGPIVRQVSFDAESGVHTGLDLDVAKVVGWFDRWQEGASRWA
jgi:hypothetical protein